MYSYSCLHNSKLTYEMIGSLNNLLFRRVVTLAGVTALSAISVSYCDKRYNSKEEELLVDRAERWEKSWKKSGTKPRFHKDVVNPHLIQGLGRLEPLLREVKQPSILVPLCGKTKDMSFLESLGYKVVGVEFVQDAIDQYAEEEGFEWLRPETIEDFMVFTKPSKRDENSLSIWKGDFFKFSSVFSASCKIDNQRKESERPFIIGFDRASLVAIQPVLRRDYAETMEQLCDNIIVETLEYDQSKMDGPPFSVSVADIVDLYSENFEITLVDRTKIDDFKGRGNENVYQNRFILTRKQNISKL